MLRGLAVTLATAVVLVCAASSGAAGTAQNYADPQGDQEGNAPDVTTITVSHDARGNITWRINVANQPTLAPDSAVVLWIDSDSNPSNGAPDTLGSEYVFLIDEEGFGFGRWTGTELDFDTPGATVNVSPYSAGTTIRVNRSELGNTRRFKFWVRGLQQTGPDTEDIDDAPNDGTFSYVLSPAQGVVASKSIARVRNGLRATFVFRVTPLEGSGIRILWRVNGRQFGTSNFPIAQSVRSTALGLGKGLYTAQLQVRVPGAGWRTLASVWRRL